MLSWALLQGYYCLTINSQRSCVELPSTLRFQEMTRVRMGVNYGVRVIINALSEKTWFTAQEQCTDNVRYVVNVYIHNTTCIQVDWHWRICAFLNGRTDEVHNCTWHSQSEALRGCLELPWGALNCPVLGSLKSPQRMSMNVHWRYRAKL